MDVTYRVSSHILDPPHIAHRIPPLLLCRLETQTILQPIRSHLHGSIHIPQRLRLDPRKVELLADRNRVRRDQRAVDVRHDFAECAGPRACVEGDAAAWCGSAATPPSSSNIDVHHRTRMCMALLCRQRLRLTLIWVWLCKGEATEKARLMVMGMNRRDGTRNRRQQWIMSCGTLRGWASIIAAREVDVVASLRILP